MDESWKKKLDVYSRRSLDPREDEPHGFDVTVRLNKPDAGGVEILKEAGFEVQAAIGPIVAGHVSDRAALMRVARLSCVEEVQASRALYIEPDPAKE